jgi:hypothetical protein
MTKTMTHARRDAGLALALIGAGLGATGCTTVRSTHLPPQKMTGAALKDAPSAGGRSWSYAAQGVTYFLPTRPMKITATRTPVVLGDSVKAQAAKEKELADAKAAQAKADEEVKSATGIRDNLQAQAPAGDRAAAEQAVNLATAKAAAAKKSVDTLSEQVAALKATVDAVKLRGTLCTYEAKIELLPAQPDPYARYVARIVHNPFRDDTMTLKVGPNGLLTSGNMVAADRTSDILVEAAGAIAGVGATPPSIPGLKSMAPPRPRDADCTSLPKTYVQIFDPTNPDQVAALNQDLSLKAKLPYQVSVYGHTPAQDGRLHNQPGAYQGDNYGWAAQGAIFYRSPSPLQVSLLQSGQPVDTAVVLLPQAGPISFIPMNSSAFVKTVNDVQFTDGMLTSWTADRPSEVLEVVRLPVKIATAIISVPAQLLSLRVNYSSQDKALLEAQQAQIAAEAKLQAYMLCLSRAGDDAALAAACAS